MEVCFGSMAPGKTIDSDNGRETTLVSSLKPVELA